jgi:SAM-dependent methyltransferase
VRQAVLGRWQDAAEALYREVGDLIEVERGGEVIVAGCGEGITTEWIAARTGASVTGVDPDPERVERAEARSRSLARPLPLTYEQAPLDDLPHESAVFDAGIGEPVLAAALDPARAVAELARVVKPMGTVVLLELTWNAEIPAESRTMLVERLGLRPQHLVQWKRMMREAGLVDIQVQDWTAQESVPVPPAARARAGEAEEVGEGFPTLTWRQKMHIVGRAWRRWGWREARSAVAREEALLRELAREGVLGFRLLRGVKWPHAMRG